MQALIQILMAGVLLIQALTGWCDRSLHACISSGADAADVAQTDDCCGHETSPVSETDSPAGPCPSKSECHGVCTYVPTQEKQVDIAPKALPATFVSVESATTGADLGSSISLEALWRSAISEPPVRLHLMHQIILI